MKIKGVGNGLKKCIIGHGSTFQTPNLVNGLAIGEQLLTLKGGKWKGCYHVPRGLYQCWKTLERIE